MAGVLNEAEIAAALRDLPEWSGGEDRLQRTVQLGEDRDRILAAISRAADELDHHPVLVEPDPGSVRFEVWTHSAGGVTARDLELAHRIDELLAPRASGHAE